ncbi:MAG: sulfotransferase domain-containing protein, partial [Cyanobacteria bacterium J06636_16]
NYSTSSFIDSIKYFTQELIGFSAYHALPKRQVVCLVSSMRAGSTLLKALLGQADDISHLPEYDFSILNSFSRNRAYYILLKTVPERYIVLKKPRWFADANYPSPPPVLNCKFIVLFRDMPDVVTSLMKRWPDLDPREAVNYWYETYNSIFEQLQHLPPESVCYASYHKLLEFPEQTTFQLFKFIGSKQPVGVSKYTHPDGGWKWGRDDGSNNIFTMTVQNTKQRCRQLDIEIPQERLAAIQNLSKEYGSLIERSRLSTQGTENKEQASV